MVGRAVAGALAAVPRLNILHLNNVSLVVTGLSTGLVTVLCTSYASMIVYAVVYGLSVGMLHSKSKLIMSYILGGVSGQWCRQARAWARGLSPREMSLSPRRETDWSRIRRRIVRNFQILIVSAVKIFKECLQTASVSGTLSPRPSTGPLPPDLPGLRSWTPLGDFRPQTPGLWPHINIHGAAIFPIFRCAMCPWIIGSASICS